MSAIIIDGATGTTTTRALTPEELAQRTLDQQREAVRQATEDAETVAQSQVRQAVLTLAQSAVGVRFDQLTAAQVRVLFAIVLRQAGALNADGTVRPLAGWAR